MVVQKYRKPNQRRKKDKDRRGESVAQARPKKWSMPRKAQIPTFTAHRAMLVIPQQLRQLFSLNNQRQGKRPSSRGIPNFSDLF